MRRLPRGSRTWVSTATWLIGMRGAPLNFAAERLCSMVFTKRILMLSAALALAVALPSCSGGSSSIMMPGGSSADVVITITGINGSMSFTPNPASVRVGQTVAWRNGDSITHTATQDGYGFSTGAIAGGATSAPVLMGSVGTIGYHCNIHPSMTGTLDVTN